MSEAVIIIILIVVAVAISIVIMMPVKKFLMGSLFESQSYFAWKVWRFVMAVLTIIIFAGLVYVASLLNWIKF